MILLSKYYWCGYTVILVMNVITPVPMGRTKFKESTSYSVSTCQYYPLGIQTCKVVVLIIFTLLIKHGKIQGKENEGK